MPMYDYQCSRCLHNHTEFMRMCSAAEAPLVACPKCNYQSVRQVSLPHTDLKEFHTPIEMYSIAMDTTEEVQAFKRKCPDVDCVDDPEHEMFGIPIARSRKAKLQALDAAGYVESK